MQEHIISLSDSFAFPLCFSIPLPPQSLNCYRKGKWVLSHENKSVRHIVRSVLDISFDYFGYLTSLTEKDVLVSSLQEELREEREKMATDAVRLSLHTSG